MRIVKEEFGNLKSGEEVIKYKLVNQQLQVNVLNYGGIITEIYTPDREGKKENIVLGFDNIADYEEKSPYYGAIIGLHAGRIEDAKFSLEGQVYQLTANEGNNNIHGGLVGLDKRIWKVREIKQGIELNYVSPHLEEGFPANIKFTVRYLLDNNKLVIEYVGEPDRETIINLTNHTYFNLSGAIKKDILDHQLKIKADKFVCLGKDLIPTGEIRGVEGTPFDFRRLKEVGEEIEADCSQLALTNGYDHPFVLEEGKESIILKEEESGRVLSISTDQPVVVFYSGNHFTDAASGKRLGLCLETQDYPNAINTANFPINIYTPVKEYRAKTEYKFDEE